MSIRPKEHSDAGDPEVLVVSGVLKKSGTFEFRSSFALTNGTLTESNPAGDFTISTVDGNNKLINSISVHSNFNLIMSVKNGAPAGPAIVDAGAMPVVVSLPLDSNIESIQVSQNGKLIQKASLKSQLLEGIFTRIPDNAFKTWEQCDHDGNHSSDEARVSILISRDRKILARRVSRIESILNSKHPRAAIEPLTELIEDFERMTNRNYTTSDSSELSQSEVISQIRSIIISLKSIKDKHHSDEDGQ